MEVRTCPECRTEVTGRPNKKYCSMYCQRKRMDRNRLRVYMRVWRARQK